MILVAALFTCRQKCKQLTLHHTTLVIVFMTCLGQSGTYATTFEIIHNKPELAGFLPKTTVTTVLGDTLVLFTSYSLDISQGNGKKFPLLAYAI